MSVRDQRPKPTPWPQGVSRHLAESALTDEATQSAGVYWCEERLGLVFPYLEPDGTPMLHEGAPYERWRRFEPDPYGEGWQPVLDEPRYLQAAGTRPRLYWTPGQGIDWEAVRRDPSFDVVLTEGEKKALAACAHGLRCLSIGGVASYRTGIYALTDLERIDWRGRRVWLCFDGDTERNPDVRRELEGLSNLLYSLGGLPLHLSLEGLEQKGLDDVLQAQGLGPIQTRMEHALPAVAPEVLRIDAELIHVAEANVFVRKGQAELSKDAVTTAYAHEAVTVGTRAKDGTLRKRKAPALQTWLEWPGHQRVDRFALVPGQPEIFEAHGLRMLNRWKGWGVEARQGDLRPWHELLARLLPDEAGRAWFEQWCAYRFQTGLRPYTGVLLIGKQGTGKSMLCRLLARVHGPQLSRVVSPRSLEVDAGRHEWAIGATFVYLDDSEGSGATRRFNLGSLLKTLITADAIEVNAKYQQPRQEANQIQFIACSNHYDEIPMDNDDRRWYVSSTDRLMEPGVREQLGRAVDSELPSALLWHLQHDVSLEGFDRWAVPASLAKAQVVEATQTAEEYWLRALLDGALDPDQMPKWSVIRKQELFDAWHEYVAERRLVLRGPKRHPGDLWSAARRCFPAKAFRTLFATGLGARAKNGMEVLCTDAGDYEREGSALAQKRLTEEQRWRRLHLAEEGPPREG